MTLTIELPDHLARLAADAGLTRDDLNRSALRGVAAEVVASSHEVAQLFRLAEAQNNEHRIQAASEIGFALQESAEDVAAGRVTPLEQVVAEAQERRRRRDAAIAAGAGPAA